MKFRKDFITNSSSASYIICFARIANEDIAKRIIDKHSIEVYNNIEVWREMRYGFLGADWAGATIWEADDILRKNPNGKYVIIDEYLDADYDEDSCEPIYFYGFDVDEVINDITEENGFVDIYVAEGEGYNG